MTENLQSVLPTLGEEPKQAVHVDIAAEPVIRRETVVEPPAPTKTVEDPEPKKIAETPPQPRAQTAEKVRTAAYKSGLLPTTRFYDVKAKEKPTTDSVVSKKSLVHF